MYFSIVLYVVGQIGFGFLGYIFENFTNFKGRIFPFKKKRQCVHLLPGKLTCPLKINGWKMYFLLK